MRPSPSADATFVERDIPVHIGGCTVLQVMTHQVPGINGTPPVVPAVAAFLLCLIELHSRITLVDSFDRSFSRPLETDTADILSTCRIGQNGIDKGFVGTFHRSEHNFDIQFLHSRAEVVTDKVGQRGGSPATTGEYLCRIKFVLRHDGKNVDALSAVGFDEFGKVKGIRPEIKRILDKHVCAFVADFIGGQTVAVFLAIGFAGISRGVVLIVFHPGRGTPGGSPDTQVRIVFLCTFDERDQCLLIVGDSEVLHIEIPVGFVI